MNADVVVIGAGLVGSAIAYGLAARHLRVVVIDGGDRDFRASNANGALVWETGKGLGMPAYQRLTRGALDLWPDFVSDLTDVTGIDLQYERNGGLGLCLGETEFEQRRVSLMRLHNQIGGTTDWEMLDRDALSTLLPKARLGAEVVGAVFGHRDGQVNSLRLLAALHAGIQRQGGQFAAGHAVHVIQPHRSGGFTVAFGDERVNTDRVVIAAGLGSKALAAQVGLNIPIHPQRGQMLITERLEPFLPLPMNGLRQTQQGTVLIGVTNEDAGFDSSTTVQGATTLAATAIRRFPALSEATVVRQWAGLRILTPDEHPIYSESASHPGAFIATCHSGVTLAAAHAGPLADAVSAGSLSPAFDAFHQRRFDVPQAA